MSPSPSSPESDRLIVSAKSQGQIVAADGAIDDTSVFVCLWPLSLFFSFTPSSSIDDDSSNQSCLVLANVLQM